MDKRSRSLVDLVEIAVRRHGEASGRQLAEIAHQAGHDVSHTTLNRIRNGDYASRPSDATIRAIAYLAKVSETAAFVAAGVRPPAAEQYQLPAEAQRMSMRQRRALDELVRAFVDQEVPPVVPAIRNLVVARDDLAAALETGDLDLTGPARSVITAIDELVKFAGEGADSSSGCA